MAEIDNDLDDWDDPSALLDSLDGGVQAADDPDQDNQEADGDETPEPEQRSAGNADDGGHGGDRLVPVKALAEVREELRAAKERAEALEAALREREGAGQPGPVEPAAEDAGAWSAERAALAERLAEIEGDDEDLAAALRGQIAQGDRLARLESVLGAQAQSRAAVEAAERDAAFAESPLLQAWAADEARPMWHQTAVGLHEDLMRRDARYQALPWRERFAALERAVERSIGVPAPHRAALGGRGGQQAPQPRVPVSSSHIPGGEAGALSPRSFADLSEMPETDATAALLEMAEDGPDALYAFLDQAPYGSLNSRANRTR